MNELREALSQPVKLAIMQVGEDAGANFYAKGLIRDGSELGIQVDWYTYDENEEYDWDWEINDLAEFYDGIVVTSPPCKGGKVTIPANKDVDNWNGDGYFFENGIVVGLVRYLEDIFPEGIAGKVATVFGKGKTAGAPIIKGLRKRGAIVNVVDSKTSDEEVFEAVSRSDLLVMATGVAGLLDCTHVGIPVIDYGTPGDCINGGVKLGKMTCWGVFKNLIDASKMEIHQLEFVN